MEVAALNWAFCRDSAWFLCPWKHFGLISSPVFSPNVKFIKGSSQSLSNVPGSTNQKILKKQTKQQCISQTFLFPCNSIWLHCSHQLFSWAGIICMSTVGRLTHALSILFLQRVGFHQVHVCSVSHLFSVQMLLFVEAFW